MIVYKTTMSSIPNNCADCMMQCTYPTSMRDCNKILKKYLIKRHPQCPLIEIHDAKEVLDGGISK